MPDTSANRDKLTEVLALQLAFLDQEQLRTALRDVDEERSRPLDKVLLDRGLLDFESHALLVALVDKQLELHNGDLDQCLEAAHSASTRGHAEQLRSSDTDLSQESAGLATERSDDPFETMTRVAGPSPPSAGRYRINGPAKQGGMGKVSTAIDAELQREVALKEIREEFADDENCRERFVLEAEITGGLEHPGVVPVYGMGRHADGRPYYAMRYIRGANLKQAIDRFHGCRERQTQPSVQDDSNGSPTGKSSKFDSLEFRKLLGRFIDVCNTVEYAHSRGVIHRDLKPENIMLGAYGETLVVDWGLAKVTGREDTVKVSGEETLRPSSGHNSDATRQGQAMGTPQYMPPEQAVGDLEQIGAASDIYSLGATLYCLLTGQAPFAKVSRGEILYHVKTGDFPRPTDTNHAVPRLLEAVCMRAMATNPQERYQSAAGLAEDVERYLAAGPAAARVERLMHPPTRGLMGWAYRHPLLTAVILGITPNALLSAANVWYDGHVILSRADVKVANVFWGMLVFWKVLFYGFGTGFALWQVLHVFVAMQGQSTLAAVNAARKKCLRLGEVIFWVSVAAWAGAGLVFPAWIDFVLTLSGNANDEPVIDVMQYVHFITAHVLFGLVSGAIVMSSISFVAIRLFYPRLLRMSGAVDVKADGLQQQSKRIDVFNSLAAVVPFIALIYMNFVDTQYKPVILAMVLLGLLLMYLVAVKAAPEIRSDLEALGLAPTTFHSNSTP